MQGGAIFFEGPSFNLTITNCTFYANQAALYGDTFASVAQELIWTKEIAVDGLHSGDTLPFFSVAMMDIFQQSILPLGFRVDFVFVEIQLLCFGPEKEPCQASVATEIAKPVLGSESPFSKTEVIGYPGTYTLLISPVLNYDRSRFRLEKNITILECLDPSILFTFARETVPRCVLRKYILICMCKDSLMIILHKQQNVFRDVSNNMANVST
jgi:hypothetical protein